MFKSFIQKKLETYVQRYFAKHPEVKLVVVVGSVGKTSSKNAIATILAERYRIRMQNGNLNTEVAAPCAILGIEYPESIRNPLEWLNVFAAARKRISSPADVDVVIQELGADHPGDIASFGRYLKPDLAVVTAVTPEHMEFFGTIEAVAKEELSVSDFAAYTLINRDDVDGRFADFETNPNFSTYGTTGAAEYRFETGDFSRETGYTGNVIAPEFPEQFPASLKVLGEHSIRSVVAGVAVAARLGLTPREIQNGAAKVQPVPGRMNMLAGIGDVTVIDDSYNSSPAAAEAAVRTLYSFDEATQRIAILGDMRELGETSRQEHEMLASVCDPNLIAWIVTVGPDMESFFTPVAKQRGCQVKNCRNAIEAAQFVRSVVEPGAVVLVKGSQNTISLEEAVKLLIDNSEDVKLVRQSEGWKKTKDKYFSQFY